MPHTRSVTCYICYTYVKWEWHTLLIKKMVYQIKQAYKSNREMRLQTIPNGFSRLVILDYVL